MVEIPEKIRNHGNPVEIKPEEFPYSVGRIDKPEKSLYNLTMEIVNKMMENDLDEIFVRKPANPVVEILECLPGAPYRP
jgi:hypothetical protein